MKNRDRILKYFSDLMDENEKAKFEEELNQSKKLRVEFNGIKSSLKTLKDAQPQHTDDRYFTSLLPAVRSRLDEGPQYFRFNPKFAFALSLIIAIFTVLVLRVNEPSVNETYFSDLEELVGQMTSKGKINNYEEFLTEGYYHSNYSEYGSTVSELIESEYIEEIISSSSGLAPQTLPYLEGYYLIQNMETEEFDALYNDLKNTKIL